MDSTVMSKMPVQNITVQKRGISGSTIKIIAIVAMLIDHIGATIVERIIFNQGLMGLDPSDVEGMMKFFTQNSNILFLYLLYKKHLTPYDCTDIVQL